MEILIKKTTVKNCFVSIILIICLLTDPSLIIEYLLYRVGFNLTYFRILMMGFLVLIAVNSHQRKPVFFINKLMTFFCIGIIYIFILYNTDILVSGPGRNFLRSLCLFPLFLIIMKGVHFNLKLFIKYYISVVFILALLSIIQYFGAPLGIIPVHYTSLSGREGMGIIGIGGYYSGPLGHSILSFPRNIGFFTEPANFAQLMMVPLFLSAYKLFQNKSNRNTIVFLTISLAFFLTFSVANFFGLFSGILLYYYIKMKNPTFLERRKNLKRFLSLVMLIIVAYMTYGLFTISNRYGIREGVVLGKGTVHASENRLERLKIYFDAIKNNPFGNWKFREVYHSNPGFFGHVILAGGIPFGIFMVLFLFYFFQFLYRTLRNSKFLLIYCGMFAFILPMLWDVQFFEAHFLFLLAFFGIFVEYDLTGGYRFRNSNLQGSKIFVSY